MSDMICRKSMARCITPGMCSPHGGCKDPAFNPEWDRLKAAQESLREHMQIIAKQNDELVDLRARLAERDALLKLARQFVVNGVDLGYIRMPDCDTPDPAHDLLPMIDAALSASAEPSAPVEKDWEPLTSAGQVQLGDWMSFRVAGSHICAKATLIIDPGTEHEEIVYNVKKNHYFITSMAIDGTSTHKGVLVSKSKQEIAQ
jgi:hypothetical protein